MAVDAPRASGHTGRPAALAIVPIARLIVLATEQLATHTGDAVGGLLNATFGNAPELTVYVIIALMFYFMPAA